MSVNRLKEKSQLYMKGCPVMMTKLVIATVLSIRKNTLKAMPIRKVI